MAEETVILHFEVDQGAAERKLEKIEGLLLDNKKAQQELSLAYKKGVISQEEYVKENIRLQQNIKKEQDQKKTLIRTIETESNSRNSLRQRIGSLVKEYDNLNIKTAEGTKRADALQKELAQLNDQLNKGSKSAGLFKDNIGKYPDTFGPAIQNIRVAGVSVGDLGTKLASFANPATAALGIVSALGAAYARSTAGAKDLEFAQNQLAAATTLVSNAFAEFISSSEEGEGIVSSFINSVIARFSPATANVVKFAANLKEEFEDLGRTESKIRAEANKLVEKNQELLEEIADDQTKLNQKLIDANIIEGNLEANKKNILGVLKEQLSNLAAQLSLNQQSDALKDAVLAKEQEITKEGAALEKQLLKIRKQQTDLNNEIREQLRLNQEIFELDTREANAPPVSLTAVAPDGTGGVQDPIIAASKARQDQYINELQTVKQTEAQKIDIYKRTQEILNLADQQRLQTVATVAQIGMTLFDEQTAAYKTFASASTIISTYSAATKAYESAFLPVPTVASPALGAVSAALAIAQGLANLAVINGVQFAEGGYTGDGAKWEPKGVVHGGEFVIPKETVSHFGKSHFNQYLPQYADGGFVAHQGTAPINQQLIVANALKNLPPVFASWTEGKQVGRRIEFKEKLSSLQ